MGSLEAKDFLIDRNRAGIRITHLNSLMNIWMNENRYEPLARLARLAPTNPRTSAKNSRRILVRDSV